MAQTLRLGTTSIACSAPRPKPVGGSMSATPDTRAEQSESSERINSIVKQTAVLTHVECKRLFPAVKISNTSQNLRLFHYQIYQFLTSDFFCSCIRICVMVGGGGRALPHTCLQLTAQLLLCWPRTRRGGGRQPSHNSDGLAGSDDRQL